MTALEIDDDVVTLVSRSKRRAVDLQLAGLQAVQVGPENLEHVLAQPGCVVVDALAAGAWADRVADALRDRVADVVLLLDDGMALRAVTRPGGPRLRVVRAPVHAGDVAAAVASLMAAGDPAPAPAPVPVPAVDEPAEQADEEVAEKVADELADGSDDRPEDAATTSADDLTGDDEATDEVLAADQVADDVIVVDHADDRTDAPQGTGRAGDEERTAVTVPAGRPVVAAALVRPRHAAAPGIVQAAYLAVPDVEPLWGDVDEDGPDQELVDQEDLEGDLLEVQDDPADRPAAAAVVEGPAAVEPPRDPGADDATPGAVSLDKPVVAAGAGVALLAPRDDQRSWEAVVEALLDHLEGAETWLEVAQRVVEDAAAWTETHTALLVREPDGLWYPVAGVGLRQLEFALKLADTHPAVEFVTRRSPVVVVQDTDELRGAIANMPLASRRSVLVGRVPGVQAVLVAGTSDRALGAEDVHRVGVVLTHLAEPLRRALERRAVAAAVQRFL